MDANRDDGRDYEHSECMIWLSLRDDQLYLQIKINLLGLSFWSLCGPILSFVVSILSFLSILTCGLSIVCAYVPHFEGCDQSQRISALADFHTGRS